MPRFTQKINGQVYTFQALIIPISIQGETRFTRIIRLCEFDAIRVDPCRRFWSIDFSKDNPNRIVGRKTRGTKLWFYGGRVKHFQSEWRFYQGYYPTMLLPLEWYDQAKHGNLKPSYS